MAIPTQKEMRIPLLLELLEADGKGRPKDLAEAMAKHFPDLTQEDQEVELKSGAKKYYNRVQ